MVSAQAAAQVERIDSFTITYSCTATAVLVVYSCTWYIRFYIVHSKYHFHYQQLYSLDSLSQQSESADSVDRSFLLSI